MQPLIQQLESRLFLSVTALQLTADYKTVLTDSTATRAALSALRKEDTALRTSLAKAVKLVDTKADKASNNALLNTLNKLSNSSYAKIVAAENSLLNTARAYSLAGSNDGKKLLAHPTKTAYQTKVTKDIALLNAIPAKLTLLANAVLNTATATSPLYTEIITANPSVTSLVTMGETTGAAATTVFSNAATQVVTDTSKLASDLGNPFTPTVDLTGLTLFRGDSTGNNLDTLGTAIAHGGWTTGLDVQNVPGNYGAELFISTVANPTPSQFLTPGALNAALSVGVNTFYFFADGDDTAGGSATFGLNLFLNNAGPTAPSLSGYTIPGTGQTLTADAAPSTAGANFVVTPGAGTLVAPNGSSATSTVTLSSFVVQGVSGQNSNVDLVNSTNTQAFTPPAHADGVPDTYGTFTITVTG